MPFLHSGATFSFNNNVACQDIHIHENWKVMQFIHIYNLQI